MNVKPNAIIIAILIILSSTIILTPNLAKADTTETGTFWIDQGPGNGHDGGKFEIQPDEPWSTHTKITHDDFDDTASLINWADNNGIYSAQRNDQDLNDGTSEEGAWCIAAAEEGGMWGPEDSRGYATFWTNLIKISDYVDTTQTDFEITSATLYCDYRMWSNDFDDNRDYIYLNMYIVDITEQGDPVCFDFQKHSGNGDAPNNIGGNYPGDGYCTDYWDPGDGDTNPDDPAIDNYQVSNLYNTGTLANYFNNRINHEFQIYFHIDIRLYGENWDPEKFKFRIDDFGVKCDYSYTEPNTKPNPPTLDSPTDGKIYTIPQDNTKDVTLKATTTDPDGDEIQYRFLNADTDQVIGTTGWKNSGEQGSITWANLNPGTYNWYAKAKDDEGYGQASTTYSFTIEEEQNTNNPPGQPSKPSGPSSGQTGESLTYSTSSTDPEGHSITYRYDWDDGNTGNWGDASQTHTYNTEGSYTIKAQAKDQHGEKSQWSTGKTVTIQDDDNPSENQPPYIPSNPTPYNNEESIDINHECVFSWDGGDPDGDSVTYDFYLNVCPEPSSVPLIQWWQNDMGDKGYQKNLQNTESHPVPLNVDQKYYWKVIAKDEHGLKTESPIWSFKSETKDESQTPDNNPPNKPTKPTFIDPIDPLKLRVGDFLIFTTSVVEPDGDNVNIYWDFDNDDNIDTQQLNMTCNESHSIIYIWDKPVGDYNIRVISSDSEYNELSEWSDNLFVRVIPKANNNPPNTPSKPAGENTVFVNTPYTFKTMALDPNEDRVRYQWDFGDGTITDWDETFWLEHEYQEVRSYIWENEGAYDIKVRVMDYNGEISPWSTEKRIHVVKQYSATIFTQKDFTGAYHGDIFDNFPGQGRLMDARNGTIVTGAFGGFPAGHAWSLSCQGVDFYVGREKELTIDVELSYISGTEFLLPSYAWLSKVIRIDNFFEPEKEYKDWINNLISLQDIKTPTAILERAPKGGPRRPNYMHLAKPWLDKTNVDVWTDYSFLLQKPASVTPQTIDNYFSVSRMGQDAITRYNYMQNAIAANDVSRMTNSKAISFSRMVSPTKNSGAISGTSTLSKVSGIISKISLIITVAFEIWTLYQLMTHWEIETLLDLYEEEGKAFSEHYIKKHTFDKGDHNVWGGIQSEAEGFAIFFGFAYAAGMVKSITIEGIAPPEKPTLYYPETLYSGEKMNFRPYCLDQNDDPIKYIIDWGDGTTTTTDFYDSEEEGLEKHKYTNPGTFTIEIYAEDCDKMESETKTYEITVIEDTEPPSIDITKPNKGIYFYNDNKAPNFNGRIIIGDITIEADASDNYEIDKVIFEHEDGKTKTDQTIPYSWYCTQPNLGFCDFYATVYDKAGNSNTDSFRTFYLNLGNHQNSMTTTISTQGEIPKEQMNKTDCTIISQPKDFTETQIQNGINQLKNMLTNDYSDFSITYKYEVDYGDGSPVETFEKQYPILQINHEYPDDQEYTITITLTTTLTIDGHTYTHTETIDADSENNQEKTMRFQIFERLFARFPMLARLFEKLLSIN